MRVLEERSVMRLGSERSLEIDVRLIAATHRDLVRDVADGRFREDLYFRVNVLPIHVPPLRDQKEDIRPLAMNFVRKHASRPGLSISEGALDHLMLYRWRGNVRELENAIERALAFSSSDELQPADFAFLEAEARPLIADSLLPGALQQQLSLKEVDDLYIRGVLEQSHGNQTQAARILGIDRRTLSRRLASG